MAEGKKLVTGSKVPTTATTGIRTIVELLLKGVYSSTFNVDVNQLTRIRVLNSYKLYS
jgi:hypothetical protein